MKAFRLMFLAAMFSLAYAAPSFSYAEPENHLYKITCPSGSQHLFYGTYAQAEEFASIIC